MKKQIIEEAPYYFDWRHNTPIEQIKKDIVELEKLGVTSIYFGTEDIEVQANINAYIERMETDEEYEERIIQESEMYERQKRNDLAQLERLKKKYNL